MADRFGVTRACFSNWWRRYPPDDDVLPTPEPDAFIDDRPVWLESSWPMWEAWRRRHDGAEEPDGAQVYVNQAEIARRLNVSPQTVSNWRSRYGPSHEVPAPQPDSFASGSPIWLEKALEEWDAWIEQRKTWVRERRAAAGLGGSERERELRERGERKIDIVTGRLRELISSGEWAPGAPIPTTRELGEYLGVSPVTVTRAIGTLRDEGLLTGGGRGQRDPIRVSDNSKEMT